MKASNYAWTVALLASFAVPPALARGTIAIEDLCGLFAWGEGHMQRCYPDLNGNGTLDDGDLEAMKSVFFSTEPRADLNGDGIVNFGDLAILYALRRAAPKAWAQGRRPDIADHGEGEGEGACPMVDLTPSMRDVQAGDTFSVTVRMNFTCDPTFGGGIDVRWDDNLLNLVAWNPIPFGEPALSRPGDIESGLIDGFAFGSFFGLSGPAAVATATFQALADGESQISMTDDADGVGGPFVSVATFAAQVVDFEPADIDTGGGHIAGFVSHMALQQAGCMQTNNPPPVFAPLSPGDRAFDCTDAGLVTTTGVNVSTNLRGIAVCGDGGCDAITAELSGVAPRLIWCTNLSTGQEVQYSPPPPGTMLVECSAEGLNADHGDSINVRILGNAL